MQTYAKEVGSEFDWDSNIPYQRQQDCPPGLKNGIVYYRSGRDALRAIACRYRKTHRRVLLPALCCESMVTPFLDTGYEAAFYSLNREDLTADAGRILSDLDEETVFLWMDYFGVTSLSQDALRTIRERVPGAIFVKDRTHDLLEKKNEGVFDYLVASVRKWLAIPDGGVLYSKHEMPPPGDGDPLFSQLRSEAMKEKSRYLEAGNPEMKQRFREKLGLATKCIDDAKEVAGMSQDAKKMLSAIDFLKIAAVRKENVNALEQAVQGIKGVELLPGQTERSGLYYPVMIRSNRDRVQSGLAERGIYCPVIWPEPEQARGVCPTASYIAGHMLALPCDQRYGSADMHRIGKALANVVGSME
ncbi:MAG: hypothetical protein HFE39_01010 [Clostridiales bacterium]|nr:hypothetical protein [Clostridiales bacterium]